MKPKEGTILTVASGIADKAAELALETEDLRSLSRQLLSMLDEVPSEDAGDAPGFERSRGSDSGGQGLLEVIRGA